MDKELQKVEIEQFKNYYVDHCLPYTGLRKVVQHNRIRLNPILGSSIIPSARYNRAIELLSCLLLDDIAAEYADYFKKADYIPEYDVSLFADEIVQAVLR